MEPSRKVFPGLPAALACGLSMAGAAFVAGPARAQDAVDLQVGPRDTVDGTLRPASESESFLVAGLRGSKVKATARATDDAAPIPVVRLYGSDGTTLLAGETVTGDGTRTDLAALPTTEGVRFRVVGDGTADGDYELVLKVKPRTRWDVTTDPVAAAGTVLVSFAAPRGSAATIEARTTNGAALPVIEQVEAPGGAVLAGSAPTATPQRVVRVVHDALPADGEYQVRLRNDGADGALRLRVTLRRTTAAGKDVDVSDAALTGTFGGSQAVVGRIADPLSTTIIDGETSGLAGITIEIPPDALSVPTVISMAESEPFYSDPDANEASTTVRFEPAGTEFAIPATVTLPFDAGAFDDPSSELSIVVESADGTQEVISATSIDIVNQTATFPVSHFSRFQAVSPRPRPLRGAYTQIDLRGRLTSGFGGLLTTFRHDFQTTGGTRAARTISRDTERFILGWGTGSGGPVLAAGAITPSGTGTATTVSRDRIDITGFSDDFQLSRGRDPRVLTGSTVTADEVFARFVFQRVRGVPTRGNLKGLWRAAILEFGGTRDDTPKVLLFTGLRTFDLDVGPAGTARVQNASVVRFGRDFPASAWSRMPDPRIPKRGTLTPSGGSALLDLEPITDLDVRDILVTPVLGGDLLVGTGHRTSGSPAEPSAAALQVVVLVREGAGKTANDVAGSFLGHAFSIVPDTDSPAGSAGLRYEVAVDARTHSFPAPGSGGSPTASGTQQVFFLAHDAAGEVVTGMQTPTFDLGFRVTSDGRYQPQLPAAAGLLTATRPAIVLNAVRGTAIRFGFLFPGF